MVIVIMNNFIPSINRLIDRFKRATPLTITRTNQGAYSTTQLKTTSDSADTTIYIEGAIIPHAKEKDFNPQIAYDAKAYIKAKDTSGNDFFPQVGDILTAERVYRVEEFNIYQVNSEYQGFILDLAL